MKIHFNQKSLNEICSSLNAGLVEYKDLSKISIYSEQKPGFLIQIVEVNLEKHLQTLIDGASDLIPNGENFNVEISSFDYFVFTLGFDENGEKVLTNMPLFELIIASNNLLADETGISSINTTEWDLTKEMWNCIEQD